MIGKIFPKSSGSFKKRIRYIFGCTKHDHQINQILTIDYNCISSDPLPALLAGSEDAILEMVREFDQVEILRRMSIDSDRPIKPVFHAMMSLRPGESLTPAQWLTAVRKYMADLGFTETCKYVAVMHRDKDHEHVHIVANRIALDEDFRMVKDSDERAASMESVSEIEDMFGLKKAPRPSATWGIALTHAEVKASNRDGELPHKHRLIAKIAGAIEHTKAIHGDMFDLVVALRKQRVYIHLTLSEQGQPKGISYEYDGKHISGRQLKRSRLTWQKLITQEGISYDSETLSELQVEIAQRDQDEHQRSERLRYFYLRFQAGARRIPIKVKSANWRLDRDTRLILEALEALLGIDLTFKGIGKPSKYYIEFTPGQPLVLPARKQQEYEFDPQPA
ncbi:relaxase/mobilization nuclease domain-containing protein [Pseudomonas sp. WS 5051]|uniref:relaxase/mobilization nuclease domain-containing protein n=1 Tax=Pseudomonas sp. WS 5051 TaxID=2717482 RepID=UPI001474375B|nr:relaxase/mobilization nuclease domain-containing protein [Pseudomonas sp. WS 5051]NMY54430.1 relaxase/mobilization nuclease domain-containing protein [Pseudomonas sp. WS 5051]